MKIGDNVADEKEVWFRIGGITWGKLDISNPWIYCHKKKNNREGVKREGVRAPTKIPIIFEYSIIFKVRHFDRMKCIFAKRQMGPQFSDPEFALNDMIKSFVNLNVKYIGTDFGIGHKENIRLRDRLKGRGIGVFEFLYAGKNHIPKWNPVERRYHVGKTESLDLTFSDLIRKRFLFPRVGLSKQYLSDVMNVYSEYDPNTKIRKYEHAGTGPDDFLHLANYARMIFQKI